MRDLKADLELFNKATPGPWEFGPIYAGTIAGELEEERDRANRELLNNFREGWPHAIERAMEAEAKLEKAKGLIQRWFDGEISAFGVMDSMIIDLEFDIDGIPDEALEYHNIKRKKEVLGDE